jgi:fibronectin-binding autotransporter adhesin
MKIQNSIHRHYGRFPIPIGLMLITVVSVRANYQSTVLSNNPLAYYALNITNNSGGGTATDLSGNGNNSSYYNIFPASGPTAYITNSGSFAGSSVESYVDLSTGTNTGILNFGGLITMEAWVQSTNTTQGPADILAKGYDSTINDDEIALRANGGVNYYGGVYNSINNGGNASGGQQTTNWTYLVSTYDGTNWNLYVNSQLAGQSASTNGAFTFSDPWAIGTGSADGFQRFFEGNICQVALYTNALTAAQVLNHFYEAELNASSSNSVPIIIDQPQPQSAYAGGTVTFSVTAVSAFPTTNQWYTNNVPLTGQTNATLTISSVNAADEVNYRVVVGNKNGTTNSVSVPFSLLASGITLKWSPNANSGVWDTGISTNWINVSNSQQSMFNTSDQVLFDDTVGVPTNVVVSNTVSPFSTTVNSSTNNYTFGGPGSISGSGSLIKEGTSTLTIVSPANLTGPVTIDGGTIYAGDFSFTDVASVTITNNSTLDVAGGSYTLPVTVSGAGVNGEGVIYNSYENSCVEDLNITLTGDTKFGETARWDLATGSQINGAHNLTLDLSADPNDNFYSQWNTVTIGANLSGIIVTNGSGIATNMSNLGMSFMDTSCQNPGTVFTISTNCEMIFYNGGFNGSIHVLSGGIVYIFTAPAPFKGSNLIFENGAQWIDYGNTGANTPINSAVTLNGVAHFGVGDHLMIYTNVFSGPGGFVLDYYNNGMVLSASNTYSGPTIIGSNGQTPEVFLTNNGSILNSSLIFFGGNSPTVPHIDVSGRSDKTLTLASGQTLGGIGTINGSLIVSSGATLSPSGTNTTIGITDGANSTGTIAVSNAVTLNGTTTLKLDGSGVNDEVQTGAGITYGGTLNLVNISGAPLANGNLFQIFSATSYSGSFANITPATPGAGLAWDTSQLNTGFISVVTAPLQPMISSTTVSGGNLIFSGTNGAANGSYAVLTTTNLATPLANWTSLVTNTFSATGAFNVTNAINPNVPKQFYLIRSQ